MQLNHLLFGDKAIIIWITGRPASGKTSLANALHLQVKNSLVLDGDQLRKTLSPDLGFDEAARNEHLRRTVEHVKQHQQASPEQVIIVALISPFTTGREHARQALKQFGFYEVYNNAPLAVCIARDPKGLYKKAQRGEINDMTGISHPYEEPQNPDFIADAVHFTPETNARLIITKYLTPPIG